MEKEIYEVERYFTDNIDLDVDYLKKISDNHVNILELRVYYIFALYKTNQIKLASEEIEKLITFDQSKALQKNSFFLMVKSLVQINQENEIDLLIASLEELLIIDNLKTNKWLRLELFKLYEKKEIDYLAWGYLEEAISIDENFYEAILLRAYRLDLITNCADIVYQILQLPQTFVNSDVLNFLGNAYLNCNEVENALKIFNGSLEIEVTEEAYYFIGYINHYYLDDYEKAIFYYDKSISINNLFIDVLVEKAWLLYDMSKYEDSETLFKKIISGHEEINVYNQITLFYIRTEKIDEALEYVEKSKIKFGVNHMNQGFELICLEKIKDDKYVNEYHLYKKKYSVEELSWFKALLSEI
jgi:tetratricopeptide (TPR) repeat protein